MATTNDDIEIADAHLRNGQPDLAIPIYRRIVVDDPRHGAAAKMLARALFQAGQTQEAEQAARRALTLTSIPDLDTANLLAAILGSAGRYDDVVRVLHPLADRIRKRPGMCFNLGLALRGTRNFAAAAIWLQRAIDGDASLRGVHENLGMVLVDLDRRDEAIMAFRAALALDPNNGNARHMLDSLAGTTPDAPPIDYVRALFDDYAARFDRELVSDLGYRVPQILRRMIDAAVADDALRFARVLDLGCGTGLSGAAVTARADDMTGVDLSKAMLAQARARKIYSACFAMEIGAYLVSNDARRKLFDLVIAADVFIYVGKLDATFASLAQLMTSGGLFAFSVEGGDGDDFTLRESGRYAHGGAYIDRLAHAHGFAVIAREDIAIRKAHDGAVNGIAFLLRRM